MTGKQRLSGMLLFFAAFNAFIGAAAAKLDLTYFVAGLSTGALCYYMRHVLNSEGESILNSMLNMLARAFE